MIPIIIMINIKHVKGIVLELSICSIHELSNSAVGGAWDLDSTRLSSHSVPVNQC